MKRTVIVTVTTEVEVQPFAVPNVFFGDSNHNYVADLADATPEMLSAMCDEFRAGVFAKAGKPDPRTLP